MLRNSLTLGIVGVLVAVVTAGCTTAESTATPSSSPTPFPEADTFLCTGLPITREALDQRVPVSDLGEPERTALSQAVWDDSSPLALAPEDGWYLADSTDEVISLIRDVEVTEEATENSPWNLAPDHEVLTVEWIDDATNLTPGWYVTQSSTCALTIDLGDLSVPMMSLGSQPDPTSDTVQLFVTEWDCNSGEDAEGRIEIVNIKETEDQVSVVLGVRPRGGMQNCPSNPATPFTVTLSEPIGDREIVDGGLAMPRPLSVGEIG